MRREAPPSCGQARRHSRDETGTRPGNRRSRGHQPRSSPNLLGFILESLPGDSPSQTRRRQPGETGYLLANALYWAGLRKDSVRFVGELHSFLEHAKPYDYQAQSLYVEDNGVHKEQRLDARIGSDHRKQEVEQPNQAPHRQDVTR